MVSGNWRFNRQLKITFRESLKKRERSLGRKTEVKLGGSTAIRLLDFHITSRKSLKKIVQTNRYYTHLVTYR